MIRNHSTSQPINSSTSEPLSHSTLFWKVGILIAAFTFAYFDTISSFIGTWSSRNDYSHGFLVPFISLYFIWAQRERLRYIPIQPNIPGGLISILFGGFLLLMGSMGSVVMIQQTSIIVTIPGLVLILLGTKYLRALFPPLAYLIFMVPILDVVSKIHWPLQLFSAKVASILLSLFNIPVFQNAQYLELPNITLEIANECSGLNYLVSIVAIGIPLAFLTQKDWLRRILLILSGLIIGILANSIRVALIGIWAYNGGEKLHGPAHIFKGLFVSVVGFISLFWLAWFISRIPSSQVRKTSQNVITMGNTPHLSLRGILSLSKGRSNPISSGQVCNNGFGLNIKQINHAWLITIVMLLVLGSFLYLYKPLPVSLKSPLNNFPLTIGDWEGKDLQTESFPIRVKGADYELNRIYRNSSGREIELYIGYFESQKQDKELIHYNLQDLYEKSNEFEIPLTSHGNIRVNKAVIKEGIQNYLILYWYNLNGRIIANNYKAKFITASNGLLHRRTNGAIVIVSSNLNHSDEMQKVLSDEVEFIQRILPVMKSHFSEKTG